MSNERSNQTDREKQPLREWLPKTLLTFLVLLVLAFVVYRVMISTGESDIGARGMWALIVAMVLLVLLPVVDRIQTLSVSPGGLDVALSQAQAKALKEVGALDDPEAADKILQAKNADQVHAAMKEAVELNVTRMVEMAEKAIHDKYKCYVRYRPEPDDPVQTYHVAILDIKPGKSAATRANDYLWVYSYEHESVLSLRLDRVLGIEMSKEMFDPEELMAGWKKEPEWNVEREW